MKIVENLKKLIVICTTAIISTACASPGGVLLTAKTNAVPTVSAVQAPVVSTTTQPVVTVVTVTNQVGQIVPVYQTNLVTVTVTNSVSTLVTNWTTNVVYSPSGTATTVLETAQGINTVTGPFNPFAGAITAVLALATAGLGFYAKQKTNQVNQHLSTIQTLTSAAASLEPAALAAYHAAVSQSGQTQTKAQMLTNAATAAAQNL